MSKKKINDVDTKVKTMSFFLLFFPSLMIAITPYDAQGTILKLCLLFYQYVAINTFVRKYYGEE